MITCPEHIASRPGLLRRAVLLPVLFATLFAQAQTTLDLRLGRELTLTGIGLGLNGFALLQTIGSHARLTLPADPNAVNAFDRIATRQWDLGAHRASNVLMITSAVGAFSAVVVTRDGDRPLMPVAIMAEASLITNGLTGIVKELVGRPRPYVYNADAPDHFKTSDEAYVSFWSGHTANTATLTFSCATLVQYSDASRGVKTATWIGAAVIPATMGFLRVKAGRHFPTDVIVGYVVGAAVGFTVPYLHRAVRLGGR
jgi:membrane-associated phospholipid phosphatase